MADPLSTAASVIAALQAAAVAIQYLKDVKAGSTDRTRLRDELRCTILVLEMIRDRLEDSAGLVTAGSAAMVALAAPEGPLALFKKLIEDIVAKLAPQDRLRKLAQPFRWPFDKQGVHDMLATLERLKSSFNLVMQNELALAGWLDSAPGDLQVLWCPAGAGKTTIASLVIDSLETRLSGHSGEVLAFIFCDYNNRASQSPLLLLRSILGQVLRRIDGLPQEVRAIYDLHKKYDTQPSQEQIIDLLGRVLVRFEKLYIVVDALDECSESESITLSLLSSILQLGNKVQLLCTSRFSSTFDTFFEKAARLEISARAEDVRLYVETQIPLQSRLSKHARADPKLKEEVVNAIADESQGMFLLAALHFESLSQKISRKEVRASLRTLPKTLDATYEQALVKILNQSGGDGELAETVLFWVICARAPLSVSALQHMYATRSLDTGDALEEDDLPDDEILTSLFGGLLSIDREFESVRIVHYTAQQYFLQAHQDKVQRARLEMTELSLAYLTLPNFAGGASKSDADMTARLRNFAFLEYAAHHWGSEGADVAFGDMWTQLDEFVANQDAISATSQIWSLPQFRYSHWSQDIPGNVPALVIVSCFELPQAIRRLAAQAHDLEGKGTDGETPLIRAASLGHGGNVSALLELGANVDATDSNGETALERAASEGHISVVEKLLQGGANVNAKAAASWTALMSAVSSGSIEVVRLLVEANADLAAQTDWGDSALSIAMRNGQESIATFLADRGAIMPDSRSGRRASVVAARKGLRALVRRLTTAYEAVAREGLQRQDPARGGELAFIAELPDEQDALDESALSPLVPPYGATHLSEILDDMDYTRGFSRKYDLLDKLGKGHFAEVFLCRSRVSGLRFAVKIFKTTGANQGGKLEGIRQEVRSLSALRHANMINIIDVIVQDSMDELFLVLELAPEGELFDYIVAKQKLSETESRRLFAQLFSVLAYMHERGWVHRDIKPENILLIDQGLNIKIADFGLASKLESEVNEGLATTLCGTPSYVAPEVLVESRLRKYSKSIDIWAAGVVLYICLCGFPPFSDELYSREYPYTLSQQIKDGRFDYPSPYWDEVGDPALDLIDCMLVVDAAKRFTATQCLEHPWMNPPESGA
ncbi:protein kinase domain-containing protein [Sarocladium implicatum]|nr:protein kinase domain-containing protein [Sarocladium implicatum]